MIDGFSNDLYPKDTYIQSLEDFGRHPRIIHHSVIRNVPKNSLRRSQVTTNKPETTSSSTNQKSTKSTKGPKTKNLINADGSYPVNSVHSRISEIYYHAARELETMIKTDGFYRNLIFAEHLFTEDNDDISLNNAVINVNVFTKNHDATPSSFKIHTSSKNNDNNAELDNTSNPQVYSEHVKPNKIEIVVDNEYYNTDNEKSTTLKSTTISTIPTKSTTQSIT